MKIRILVSLFFMLLLAVGGAQAYTIAPGQSLTLGAVSSDPIFQASATFSLNDLGTPFTVTLTNTSGTPTKELPQVLTGLFWNSGTTWTPGSVTATGGILKPPTTYDVGKQWAYESGLDTPSESGGAVAPGGANQGIGSVGYSSGYSSGLFSKGNFASDGDMVNGDPWGIVAAGTTSTKSLGDNPYILHFATFTLITDSAFTDTNPFAFEDVNFQYSSTLSGENLTTPLPPSALLLGSGLLGLGALGWRRRRKG